MAKSVHRYLLHIYYVAGVVLDTKGPIDRDADAAYILVRGDRHDTDTYQAVTNAMK